MEEGEEDEEEELEVEKPRKRIGRPPKVWSSILLPKEVTSALGSRRSRSAKSPKPTKGSAPPAHNGDSSHPKYSTSNMVGQAVHGVVDGSFDAGFLVSVRVGESDLLYRGVVFGPGLSIPVSKDTDVAKNVKHKRHKSKGADGTPTKEEEPTTPPPPLPPPPAPAKEEPPFNPTLAQPIPPPHYDAANAYPMETAPIGPPLSSPHHHQFAYNGPLHTNNYMSPRPHREMNMSPFMHTGGYPPRPGVPMPPPQGYSPRQNFGHVMPSPNTAYGYNFSGTQGRPTTPLPPQYRGPSDPQYHGP